MSIVTHSGLYRCLKMTFGICNVSKMFQRLVETIFHKLMKKGISFSYIDDICIPAGDYDGSTKRFKLLLQTVRDYGLQVNKTKMLA